MDYAILCFLVTADSEMRDLGVTHYSSSTSGVASDLNSIGRIGTWMVTLLAAFAAHRTLSA